MVFVTDRIRSQTQSQSQPLLSRFAFQPAEVSAHLKACIRSQDAVIDRLESQLNVISAGLNDRRRPLLSALFIGATGVGKTEMVRQVAQAIHGRSDAFCRIDMNTLAQSHYSAAITGAPPGYVGSKENLSLLNEELISGTSSRPGIVLFDEIEKADHSVVLSLMNILDNGTLKLASGQKSISFTNTLVFMTSNVGSRLAESLRWLDSVPGVNRSGLYKRALERHFNTEFINRIGIVEYFSALTSEDMPSLVEGLEQSLNSQLKRHNTSIELEPAARDFIVMTSGFRKYGARAIERRFRDLVITEVARHLTAHNDTMNTHLQGVLSERQITLLPVSLAETHSEFPSEPEFTPKSPKAT
ncbi:MULTISPECIES: AAA family ATPase [Thalassolituus]|uniref:AAA family ATPase n=2 Tax=Oceanospirillaceae TaxID=135620 RepID=UPI000C48B0B3|nr:MULTISPECIES: AAA family ATPase [Thalassolituus]MAX87551.1 AAA family ATPase [Oceanospirillaceae bacterium]|tara:strand:+ start:1960 stop:3030 length:1071 start_codon:yes stop_codon:yes gene_type:complete